jgi:hypothetical protein
MTKIIALALIMHFVVIGLVLARRPDFFRTRILSLIFAYFVVVHIAFALILSQRPQWIDPRTPEARAAG